MDEKNLWLPEVLTEYAKVKGTQLDISRPVDVAETLMPTKDIYDETKMCLYDFLEYLTSDGRKMISMALAMHMPYFAEKAPLNNKFKALAKLEMELLNRNDEDIKYYLRHNKMEEMDTRFCPPHKKRTGYAPVPTVLLDLDISDYLTDPENPLVDFVIKLYKDKRFNELELLGEDISPWNIVPKSDGPKLD